MSNRPCVVQCPTCRQEVEWTPTQQWRPFCSERCRLIDLGLWATEGWRIEGDPTHPSTSADECTDE
ncbi:MAG: DNA gyrase inhibitor YacG [Betaproteobacteria bacterium]|nr:DNA gyrase inhibitor YacG [Betaproteobacteria bacterium]